MIFFVSCVFVSIESQRVMLYVQFTKEDAAYMAKKVTEKFDTLCQTFETQNPWMPKESPFRAMKWSELLDGMVLREFTSAGFLHVQELWNGTILRHREKRAVSYLFLSTYLIDSLKISLPTDTVLLRGIEDNPKLWDRLAQHFQAGTSFESHNFSSCTYLEEWMLKRKANNYYQFVMVISIPQGYGMACMTPFSQYGEEEGELIFPFNTSFEVTKVDPVNMFVYLKVVANAHASLPKHFYQGEQKDIIAEVKKSIIGLGAGMAQYDMDEIKQIQQQIARVCPTCPPQTKTKHLTYVKNNVVQSEFIEDQDS